MLLTPKQKAVLNFVKQFQEKHGYGPTQWEIAAHFGYASLGNVQRHLVKLRECGAIDKKPHSVRGISVNLPPTGRAEAVTLPLFGKVAAGRPIEAVLDSKEIEVPSYLIGRGDHFVLEVVGDSMIDDSITHGDWVVVKKQKSASTGQMVVALVDDSATLKRYHPKKNRIELHSSNPKYPPILVRPEQSFQIEGIVSGVIRKVR